MRQKISEFVRCRVVGVTKGLPAHEVECFWKFCLIRDDLLPLFISADPFWNGDFLEVNEEFWRSPDAGKVLETLLLYVLSWNDWSETRWCVVKYASRRLLRSLACGVSRLVALVKSDPDVAGSYINGFGRCTDEVRMYLCVASCSSSPAEAVHIKLLKDDRFLKYGQELREDMVQDIGLLCDLPHLVWRRLYAIVGSDRHGSWQTLRSECMIAAVIGAGYMQMSAFSILGEPPWMYTQGDIPAHVERIRGAPMTKLEEDETTRKIAMGLANGVLPQVFVEGLRLLRDASLTTNINERAHGYGARLCEDHGRYGYDLLADRATLNSCLPLFQVSAVEAQVGRLQQQCSGLDRRRPSRTPSTALHLQAMAQERLAEGFSKDQAAFTELQSTMSDAAARWGSLSLQDKQRFFAAREQHIDRASRVIAEKKADLRRRIAALQADAARDLQSRGVPNLMSVAQKFSEEELQDLASRLDSPGTGLAPRGAMASSPEEPSVSELNELERLNAELPPQGFGEVQRPWWVRHLATNRDEWYACAIFDQAADDDRMFLMLFASKSPHFAWFLECREKARTVEVGSVEDEDHPDLPASYRQYEFLDPFVLLPDHELPIAEDAIIGVRFQLVFRGRLICSFHDSVDFDEFVRHHPVATAKAKQEKAQRRPHIARDAVDLLLAEHDLLRKEDFADDEAKRPHRPRQPKPRRRPQDVGAGEEDEEGPSCSHEVVATHDECDEAVVEQTYVDVQQELAAMREEVALHLDDQPDLYFRVVTRGRAWTLQHSGQVADSNRGEARGEFAKAWAKKYKWPLSMTFAINRYGREGSALLAKEFCRRGTYFLRLCYESPDPASFVYTREASEACPEDTDFLDFVLALGSDDPVLRRAFEVRALAPRVD